DIALVDAYTTYLCTYTHSFVYRDIPHQTFLFSFSSSAHPRDLHSFPTRRSSDLVSDTVTVGIILRLIRRQVIPIRHSRAVVCTRSEEHTSELQSRVDLVCRLLPEKKMTPGGSLCRRCPGGAADREWVCS